MLKIKLKSRLATFQQLKTPDTSASADFHALTTIVIARSRGYVAVTCQLADGVDIHALLQQAGDEGTPHVMWSKTRNT